MGGWRFPVTRLESMGIGLTLSSVLALMAVFFVMKGVFKSCESYFTVLKKQCIIRKLRYDNVQKFSEYSYKTFVRADSGRIQNTLSTEVNRVSNAYSCYFSVVQAGVLVFITQYWLLVVLDGGLSNFVYYRLFRNTKTTFRKLTKEGHVFQELLVEMVSFFKYLKATGSMDSYGSKLRKSINYIENSHNKIGLYDPFC